MIKPATHNRERQRPTIASGTTKTIKTSALRVVFDEHNQIKSIERYVTCSKLLNNAGEKTKEIGHIDADLSKEMKESGFKELSFTDATKKSRKIYIMPYHGERINLYKDNLKQQDKFALISSLMKQFIGTEGDIKPDNTVVSNTFDGENFCLTPCFIDSTKPVFTYLPQNVNRTAGQHYYEPKQEKQLLNHRLFNLTLMFYEMFENSEIDDLKNAVAHDKRKYETSDSQATLENIEHLINNKNPYAKLLQETYTGVELTIKDFNNRLTIIERDFTQASENSGKMRIRA